MPKLKSNRSAAKRFRPIANGGYKHRSAFRSHILTKKSSKRKSRLAAKGNLVDASNLRAVREMLLGC